MEDYDRGCCLSSTLSSKVSRCTQAPLRGGAGLPMIRAQLALRGKQPAKAIELRLLRPMTSSIYISCMCGGKRIWPRIRAENRRRVAGNSRPSGVVLNDPIGALAGVPIGRAYAMAGDIAMAKATYQDFLTLWKDADPDIPIYQQAKAEYAKLH